MLCGCGSALVFFDLEVRHHLVHNGIGVVKSKFINCTSCFSEFKVSFAEVMFEVAPYFCWGNPNMDLGLNPSGKRVGPVIQPSTRLFLRNPQEQSGGRCWLRISSPQGSNIIKIVVLIFLVCVSTYYRNTR